MAYEEGYYGKLASFNLDRIFRASKMTGQEFAEATGGYDALKVEKYSKILLKPSLLSALLSAYSDAHVSAIQPFPDDTVLSSCPQGKRHPANQLKRNDDLKRVPRTGLRFFCTSGKAHPPKHVSPKMTLACQGPSNNFNRYIQSQMLFE